MNAIDPVWALVPVKQPGAAKSRLAPALSPGERAELARHMTRDVLTALGATPALAGIAVLAADEGGAALARGFPCRFLEDERPGDLCASLGAAAGRLAAGGARTVVIVPADLPTLTGADVGALLAAHRGGVSVAVAARDGGTNALVLTPPQVIECLFGPDSAARHLAAAKAHGVAAARLEPAAFARDIDTVDDVLWLCGCPQGGAARDYLERGGICGRILRQQDNRSAHER
jgi:2-phospho-L-lactate guanylyltransferase